MQSSTGGMAPWSEGSLCGADIKRLDEIKKLNGESLSSWEEFVKYDCQTKAHSIYLRLITMHDTMTQRANKSAWVAKWAFFAALLSLAAAVIAIIIALGTNQGAIPFWGLLVSLLVIVLVIGILIGWLIYERYVQVEK